ncbi:hypothetical protein [Rhodanobacter sp. MP7CTX1]|uniref:hypothetical protein n=1 Tax=Rhodanobacter sp. MP7CTX1 TaxID=2723084 RepID=UPI001617CF09|nr:hypothetical protein [Rhodanobacter sp. MP7CTX1]MBB6187978.1 hypothetical protein [Rhodanobacter sp. MP7CTX1]
MRSIDGKAELPTAAPYLFAKPFGRPLDNDASEVAPWNTGEGGLAHRPGEVLDVARIDRGGADFDDGAVAVSALFQVPNTSNTLREAVHLSAFDTLVVRQVHLAETLLTELGERHRAAKWMASHHRSFDGRTAYQVLADMEEALLWNALERRGYNESDSESVFKS